MEELREMIRDAVSCHFGDEGSLPRIRLLEIPVPSDQPNFKLGSAKGEFTVPDDFNDPLPKEIEDEFLQVIQI